MGSGPPNSNHVMEATNVVQRRDRSACDGSYDSVDGFKCQDIDVQITTVASVVGGSKPYNRQRSLLVAPDGHIGIHHKAETLIDDNIDSSKECQDKNTDIVQDCESNPEGEDFSDMHSTSTLSSVDESVQADKRKTGQLKINHSDDFCKIESVRYKYKGKTYRQHYVEQVKGDTDVVGDLGIRELDELLRVNGKRVKGEKQKYVKKVFKKIKPKCSGGDIDVHLIVRRWKSKKGVDDEPIWVEVSDVDIRLTLAQMEDNSTSNYHPYGWLTRKQSLGVVEEELPNARVLTSAKQFKKQKILKRKLSVKTMKETVTNEQKLPKGNIDNITVRDDKEVSSRIKIEGTPDYISRTNDGMLLPEVLKSSADCQFKFQEFLGRDTRPMPITYELFCSRIYVTVNNASWFLSSDVERHDAVSFKTFDNDSIIDHIDERCFITRQIGDISLFQSLIYRDKFVNYDGEDNTFSMKDISEDMLVTYIRGQTDSKVRNEETYLAAEKELEGCWFKIVKVQTDGFLKTYIGPLLCGGFRSRSVID